MVRPITFHVFAFSERVLPFSNTFLWLFPGRTCETNLTDLGIIPHYMPDYVYFIRITNLYLHFFFLSRQHVSMLRIPSLLQFQNKITQLYSITAAQVFLPENVDDAHRAIRYE